MENLWLLPFGIAGCFVMYIFWLRESLRRKQQALLHEFLSACGDVSGYIDRVGKEGNIAKLIAFRRYLLRKIKTIRDVIEQEKSSYKTRSIAILVDEFSDYESCLQEFDKCILCQQNGHFK
jgi:DNA mismatch repair ATPase MutS